MMMLHDARLRRNWKTKKSLAKSQSQGFSLLHVIVVLR
jgi:hypothetical protein